MPAGWLALYQINATHRSKGCFSDVDRFDPERFSPERAEHKRTDYSLIGFGGGPRICLGLAFAQMEIKLIASMLLRQYQWTLLPDQDLSMNPVPTLKPRSGLQIKFTPRETRLQR